MLKNYPLFFIFTFFKTLSRKKVANAFLLRLSYFLSKITQKYLHYGSIESLSVEPANTCNLECPECPVGRKILNRSIKFLSFYDFKKIIDQTYKKLIYLQLYFQGEPFIHKQIYDFINYAVSKKIFTSTSTNGHFLSNGNCEKIVHSGLHQLIVSIDGTTQETFEKYRKGGNLEKVLRGIKNLQKAKAKFKKKLPHIVIQFVVFGTNEHQIEEIKLIAKNLKIKDLRLKSAQLANFKNGNKLMPKNKKYRRYKKNKKGIYELKRKNNFKCFRVWSSAVVSSNMELLPCCFDKSAEYSFGSVGLKPLSQEWKNKLAISFRKNVWKNSSKYSICKNCSEGLKKTWFYKY